MDVHSKSFEYLEKIVLLLEATSVDSARKKERHVETFSARSQSALPFEKAWVGSSRGRVGLGFGQSGSGLTFLKKITIFLVILG